MQQQMTLDILLNPSVPAEDELRLSRQAQKICRLLETGRKTGTLVANYQIMSCLMGPVSCPYCQRTIPLNYLAEFLKLVLQYQARLYEVRRALIPADCCVDKIHGKGGVNYYRIVPLSESTFFAKRKEQLGHLVNA